MNIVPMLAFSVVLGILLYGFARNTYVNLFMYFWDHDVEAYDPWDIPGIAHVIKTWRILAGILSLAITGLLMVIGHLFYILAFK